MTRGVLLYCFDTPYTAYRKIANRCVRLIEKNLGLPITIVTDSQTLGAWIDRPDCDFMSIDIDRTNTKFSRPWYNVERHMAYDHSPYEHTIVIDVDYFCFTDKLLHLLDSDYDFLVHKDAHDVMNCKKMKFDRESMLYLVWATVLIFKKTQKAKKIFDMVRMIKNNYQHFRNLYRISHTNFRNDYAFAIALHQLNGFVDYEIIPDSIATVSINTKILHIDDAGIVLQTNTDKIISISQQDIHFINKEIANV